VTQKQLIEAGLFKNFATILSNHSLSNFIFLHKVLDFLMKMDGILQLWILFD
jgi:hypothetical protein